NAAVVGQQPLRGQQRRDAVAGRGALTRGARLLAYADRHQVGSHRYSGAATRSARHAFGVVRVARLAAPRAHRLLTGYQVGSGGGGATRISGAAVTTQYIGSAARSGLAPYRASSSAPRSRASGCRRNASHPGGAPGGSGPVDGCASNAPLHVTDRSPRMFSVSSAFSCRAFGIPTRMPIWALTSGSETVRSMRP